MTPIPFTLDIPEADIEDLKTRLTRTRLPDAFHSGRGKGAQSNAVATDARVAW
jgi:hypothetical protein